MHSCFGIMAQKKTGSRLKILISSLMLLLLCSAGRAQSGGGIDTTGTGGNNTIQGRIYLPTGPAGEVRIKVRLESMDMANLSTISDVNGSFRFSGLQAGNYTIIIDGDKDYEPYREPITIDRQGFVTISSPRILTVPIYLRRKGTASGSEMKTGTVDASLAKVPKPALELYEKGIEASRKNDSAAAVENLKSAIAIYPEFPQALNELGVQYLKLNQVDNAVETLKQAVKFEPENYIGRLNYGIALIQKKEFAEAEKQCREAVKKNDASALAHLYLGVSLMRLRRLDESENELQKAVKSGRDDVSMAHYYLGGIYWGKREYGRAADELETYLKLSPQAPDADRLRSTIKELRNKH